jgi:hypothetical protein
MSCHPTLSLHARIESWHWVQHIPSTAYTEYSIQWVPGTQSTAYTEYHVHRVHHPPKDVCLPFCLMISKFTPEWSFSSSWASKHNRLPSACSPRRLKSKDTLSHSPSWALTNWWIASQYLVVHPSSASKYLCNLAWWWPSSVSSNTFDWKLPICTIMATKCISPYLLNHCLQVHH